MAAVVELSKHFKKPHCQGTSSAVQIDIFMVYAVLQEDACFKVLLIPRQLNVQLRIAVCYLLKSISCVAEWPFLKYQFPYNQII